MIDDFCITATPTSITAHEHFYLTINELLTQSFLQSFAINGIASWECCTFALSNHRNDQLMKRQTK